MATAETVDLGPVHEPKAESIKAFKEVEHELKKELVHLRHDHDKHEREYFEAVSHLSDHDLAAFTDADFEAVRVGAAAYGLHLVGRVRIPALPEAGPAYVHVRIFVPAGGADDDEPARLHCIHTEERPEDDGSGTRYRAIFTRDDPLEWFDT